MARVIFLTDFSEAYARELLLGMARYAHDTAQLITWLQSLPKPVAIMACDDNQAYHITEACLQIEGGGIRVFRTT